MSSSPPARHTKEIAFRAPTRIDFGGGWTDVPPYDVEEGGFVCNVAITRYATVRLRPIAEPDAKAEFSVARNGDVALLQAAANKYELRGARLSLTSDFPVAAGLGGSSAASVATLAAIFRSRGETPSRESIAEASRDLETGELGIAGGRQDHYAAALGGALGIRFGRSVTPTPISLSATTATELPNRCIVMYTGESRVSGNTITAVMGAYRAAFPAVKTALKRMRELAEQMVPALESGDFEALGALVKEQWVHQRSLHPSIPTPLIDVMIDHALKAGASGCKALGASGGGCVLIVAPPNRMVDVRKAIAPMGMAIDYTVDTMGLTQCA